MSRNKAAGFDAPAEQQSGNATPDRTVDIAGLLPKKSATVLGSPQPVVPAEEATHVVHPAVEPQTPKSVPAPVAIEAPSTAQAAPERVQNAQVSASVSRDDAAPVVQPATRTGTSTGKTKKSNVAVGLPAELYEPVKARAKDMRVSYFKLVVDVFDNVTDEQLIKVFGDEGIAVSASGIPLDSVDKKYSDEQINLHITAAQKAWIDQKILAVGAPSRSALISEALRIYLGL